MRSIISILVTVFSFTLLITQTTAFALPTFWRRSSFPALQIHKRGLPGAVYICTDKDFRGTCGWQMPSNQCRIPGTGNLGPESIGPDPGGFCILYENSKCNGKEVITLRFPGLGDGLPAFGSLKCFAEGKRSEANATGIPEEAGALPVKDDPRLAGGEGSMKQKKVEKLIEEMERDGYKEGMIGLEKGVYY